MKTIEDGIVFSNDIERILKGNNALDFSYVDNGIMLPEESFFKEIRKNFYDDAFKIFDGKIKILEENEMLDGIYNTTLDVLGKYPHCIFG